MGYNLEDFYGKKSGAWQLLTKKEGLCLGPNIFLWVKRREVFSACRLPLLPMKSKAPAVTDDLVWGWTGKFQTG